MWLGLLGNNLEKAGGLVTHLIQDGERSNRRYSMIDSIHFGYLDMIDMFIE